LALAEHPIPELSAFFRPTTKWMLGELQRAEQNAGIDTAQVRGLIQSFNERQGATLSKIYDLALAFTESMDASVSHYSMANFGQGSARLVEKLRTAKNASPRYLYLPTHEVLSKKYFNDLRPLNVYPLGLVSGLTFADTAEGAPLWVTTHDAGHGTSMMVADQAAFDGVAISKPSNDPFRGADLLLPAQPASSNSQRHEQILQRISLGRELNRRIEAIGDETLKKAAINSLFFINHETYSPYTTQNLLRAIQQELDVDKFVQQVPKMYRAFMGREYRNTALFGDLGNDWATMQAQALRGARWLEKTLEDMERKGI
jgi:hypothetical protein